MFVNLSSGVKAFIGVPPILELSIAKGQLTWSAGQLWVKASNLYISPMYFQRCSIDWGISYPTKNFPATRMCWSLGISSQSKQQRVSPTWKNVHFQKVENKGLSILSRSCWNQHTTGTTGSGRWAVPTRWNCQPLFFLVSSCYVDMHYMHLPLIL